MSQYIYIYAKKNDTYLCLAERSRNSKLYQLFSPYAPYERLDELTSKVLSAAKMSVMRDIKSSQDYIQTQSNLRESVISFNNDIREKLEVIDSINESIKGYTEEIAELKDILCFLNFLDEIMEPYTNKNTKLYFGIEAPVHDEEETI